MKDALKPLGSFVVALITFCSLAGGANASVLFDGTSTTILGYSTGDYSSGSEFTLANPLTIYGLAYLDAEGDGLSADHVVTLWNTAGQSLVATATVSPSDSFVLSTNGVSKWYEAAVPTTVLPAGTYRVAGYVGYNDNDTDMLESEVSSGVSGVSITWGYVTNYRVGNGTTYPAEVYYSGQKLRANVVTTPVPEPSAALLMGFGAIGFIRRRRRMGQVESGGRRQTH